MMFEMFMKLGSSVPPPEQCILDGYSRGLMTYPGLPEPFLVLASQIQCPENVLPLRPGQGEIAGCPSF